MTIKVYCPQCGGEEEVEVSVEAVTRNWIRTLSMDKHPVLDVEFHNPRVSHDCALAKQRQQ